MKELIIDEKNFEEHFKEINKNKPTKDDIIACYRAKAYLVEGELKKDIIELIKLDKGADSATKVLNKSAYCVYEDAVNLSKEIKKDLLDGLTEEEIIKKEYPYTLEIFYYTKEENVPKNNKHWTIMKIIN